MDQASEDRGGSLKRWRLILGADSAEDLRGSMGGCPALSGDEAVLDAALDLIYGGGSEARAGAGAGSGARGAGKGPSAPKVAAWIGDVRRLFPQDLVAVIQSDAIERKGLKSLLLEPESLASVKPDVGIVATLLALKELIPEKSKEPARALVRELVRDIQRRLESDLRRAVTGALDRKRHSPIPDLKAIDWKRTIARNLKGWDRERRVIVPERFHFFERARKGTSWSIILDMDQSGSMAESVIYGSVMGSILASLPAIETRVVAFDTEVVDLSELCRDDPVDLLFGVQLGGGTDIEKSVRYCEGLVSNPAKTIFILLTDLFEGGNQAGLLRRMEALRESGVKAFCLLALDDSGRPSFDQELARKLAAVGVPSFACSPTLLPELLEGVLKGYDLAELAKRSEKESRAAWAAKD